MSVPSNAEIVAGFDASIPEAEMAVIMAAHNVATYARQRGDVDALHNYANLQARGGVDVLTVVTSAKGVRP